MDSFLPALVLIGIVVLLIAGVYALGFLVSVARQPLEVSAFLSGYRPDEHAVSRYHVRWYAVTMVFLAFDMEMVFMYPWTRVVHVVGVSAVVEMFVFLAILVAGVVYAWREGALRWS